VLVGRFHHGKAEDSGWEWERVRFEGDYEHDYEYEGEFEGGWT
jgi:hypothetical protein